MRLSQEPAIKPKLFTGANYQEWADEMTFFLQGKGYWEVIVFDPPGPKAGETETSDSFTTRKEEWIAKDWRAKGHICQAIDRKYVGQIKTEESAKQMWEKMKTLFMSDSIETEFSEILQFYSLKLDEGGDLIEFISEVERLHWKLNVKGDDPNHQVLVVRIMMGLPGSWSPFMASLRANATILRDYDRFKRTLLAEWRFRTSKQQEGETSNRNAFQAQKIFEGNCRGSLGTKRLTARNGPPVNTAKRRDTLRPNVGLNMENQSQYPLTTTSPKRRSVLPQQVDRENREPDGGWTQAVLTTSVEM